MNPSFDSPLKRGDVFQIPRVTGGFSEGKARVPRFPDLEHSAYAPSKLEKKAGPISFFGRCWSKNGQRNNQIVKKKKKAVAAVIRTYKTHIWGCSSPVHWA